MRYLLIGSGVASMSAVEAIRRRDKDGSITVLNGEPFPFYYRAALSFFAKGKISEQELFATDPKFDEKLKFEIIADRAVALDTTACEVKTKAGLTIGYDRLLIATGAKPVMPPWPGNDLEGVMTYRTVSCVNRQKDFIKQHNIKKAVVIGGGITGVELAENLSSLGLDVTLLIRRNQILNLLFDEKGSAIIEAHMKNAGVKILKETAVESVQGEDGRVSSVLLANGEKLKTGFVGVAVGVSPDVGFLENSGVRINKGLMVDGSMKSNFQNIYGAGDVSVREVEGRNVPCRTWLSSAEQGRVAGANMAGADITFSETFFNASHVFDAFYGVVGEFNKPASTSVTHEILKEDKSGYTKIVSENGKITGGMVIGDLRMAWQIYKLLGSEISGSVSELVDKKLPYLLF